MLRGRLPRLATALRLGAMIAAAASAQTCRVGRMGETEELRRRLHQLRCRLPDSGDTSKKSVVIDRGEKNKESMPVSTSETEAASLAYHASLIDSDVSAATQMLVQYSAVEEAASAVEEAAASAASELMRAEEAALRQMLDPEDAAPQPLPPLPLPCDSEMHAAKCWTETGSMSIGGAETYTDKRLLRAADSLPTPADSLPTPDSDSMPAPDSDSLPTPDSDSMPAPDSDSLPMPGSGSMPAPGSAARSGIAEEAAVLGSACAAGSGSAGDGCRGCRECATLRQQLNRCLQVSLLSQVGRFRVTKP